MAISSTLFSSDSQLWETPAALFSVLHNKYKFHVDVCATAANAKLPRFYSPEQNGLTRSWANTRCFMNPPYGRDITQWVKKAATCHATLVAGLLPARTDTAWWHDWVMPHASLVHLIRGRVRFEGPAAKGDPAPFPSCVVIWLPYDRVAPSCSFDSLELP